MTTPPLRVSCFSYLAEVHTLNVPHHPEINYGVNRISDDRYLAGDGPLVAGVLRSFGHDVLLAANQVADDGAGIAIRQRLTRWDVRTLDTAPTSPRTRTNTVLCDPDGNRTWIADLKDIDHELAKLNVDAFTDADVTYIDGYEVLGSAPAPLLGGGLDAGCYVVLNLGGAPIPPWLEQTLGGRRVDVLQTNGSETDPEAAEALLQRLAAQQLAELIVVTAGKHGAWAQSASGETWQAPAVAVEVRQPQGAGAAFSAGLIHTWRQGLTIPDRLKFACAAGSAWCERGTDQPLLTAEDVEEVLKR